MNKLEFAMLRVLAVALILFIVVHFLLPAYTEEAPAVKDVTSGLPSTGPMSFKMPDFHSAVGEVSGSAFAMVDVPYDKPAFSSAFGARSKEVRLILAKFNGGSNSTEDAVELALQYLARVQNADGSWGEDKGRMGGTGLALNAFLGAGYHHRDGEHKETVAKALKFMLDKCRDDGSVSGGNLYVQGIAGVSFAEAYGLTGDTECHDATLKMLDYLAKGQGPKGGWAYSPYSGGDPDTYRYDTSVTGWVVMAFKSAKLAGLHIPKKTIEKYFEYAKAVTLLEETEYHKKKLSRGMSFYGFEGETRHMKHCYTMTASTLMCRLYMGSSIRSPLIKEGLAVLTKDLPENKKPVWKENGRMDSYLWYHAAQVGFLTSGKVWKYWNEPVRDMLVKHQIKDGPMKGAWPADKFQWSQRSKIYPIALNIMMLETYYRYYR